MSILFGLLAVISGIAAFAFANPAGLPVFGLAFAAAGYLREYRGSQRAAVLGDFVKSRGPQRMPVYALLGVGSLICAVGVLRSFHIF